ncbi:HAD-like domain-containing protein [Auriculariales sp. MPI-PUGE-AT-0066]|nr:HAD-like domain-containing protein [Auriculariales sp. MPI-PUGE-AT-0066]
MSSTTHEFDLLLFDNDGTLTNSTPGVAAAWDKFGKEYNFDGKEAEDSTHGMRLLDSMKKWCQIEDQDKLVAEVNRFEAAVIEGGPVPLPGVPELLVQASSMTQLDLGLTVAAAQVRRTDGPTWLGGLHERWYATQVLEKVGVGKPEVLVTSEDVQRGKPHPDPYLEGAYKCGFEGPDYSKVLVFEDAVSGIASGKAAGMKVLALQTTTPREALHALDPDFLVPDMTHVSVEWKNNKWLVTVRD